MIENLKKYAFFVIVTIVLLLFFLFTGDEETDGDLNAVLPAEDLQTEDNMLAVDSEVNNPVPAIAIVDVKGAVHEPGVYEIDINSRVNDVIHKAGGFTADADQTVVNLAQKVQDEMVLVIPRIGEQSMEAGSTSSDTGKVRINYATKEEIEGLNGIGPSKAEAIIAHRDEHGFFQKIEDLLEVSGIGEKTLENMKESIQVP